MYGEQQPWVSNVSGHIIKINRDRDRIILILLLCILITWLIIILTLTMYGGDDYVK